LDRDAPLESRLGTVRQLLDQKVDAVTLRLCCYVIEGGRPRDVVGTSTSWSTTSPRPRLGVARVHTARPSTRRAGQLVGSLSTLTGKNVELQVARSPHCSVGCWSKLATCALTRPREDASGAARRRLLGRLYESAFESND